MKKFIIALAALLIAPSVALALPGSSVYPNAKRGSEFGPVPCAACHKSNPAFENNLFVDVRDENGRSLSNGKGEFDVNWMPGETTTIQVVVGLNKSDRKGKLAGWFVNLPMGASLANGSVNYCYQRINYEKPSEFTADNKKYRSNDAHSITFHRYMSPQTTELWFGVGGKATDTPAGSPERKGTLGLGSVKINWVKGKM